MFVCCYRQKHRIAWTILQTDGNFPDMHPENATRAIAPEQQPVCTRTDNSRKVIKMSLCRCGQKTAAWRTALQFLLLNLYN